MAQFQSGASNGYVLKLNVNEVSTNVTNNKSVVNWSVECSCGMAYAQWNPGPGLVTVNINGQVVYNAGRPAFVFPGYNSTLTLCSGSLTVGHNADGSKTIGCSASYTATSSANYLPGNMSCSGNLGLTTIARATQPTLSASSVNIGSSVTINTPRASSSFTHILRYTFQGASATIASNVATSQAWTVPTSFISKLPDSVSGSCMIYCDTYNGSTLIGTKSVELILNVPSSYVPSIRSITATEATAGLASQFGIFVQKHTTLKIVTSASGNNGSTIKSCSVRVDGSTYSGTTVTTGVINGSGNLTISVTVTDSRGRTATSSKTVSVVAYESPAITAVGVTRATSAGVADDNGTYALCNYAYSITNVNGKNTHTFKIQYKSGSSWIDMVTYTDYSKSGNYISTKTFSVDNDYEFRFVVKDYFNEYAIEKAMPVSFTLINYGADGHSMMFGGQASAKPGCVGSYLPFAPLGGQCIHNAAGTSGSAGYVNIMQIQITGAYANTPLRFSYIRRGDFSSTDVFISFTNANNTDPVINKFIAKGSNRAIYIVKSATSTFNVYIQKSENHDNIAITAFERNYGYDGNRVTVTFKNSHASSLPSGYKQADDYRLHDGTYYIGCVLIDTTGGNPGTRYGGTWEPFAPGRTLVGVGTGNDGSTSMSFTANGEGGTYTETLTIDQIPSHNHRVRLMPAANEASGYGLTQYQTFKNRPIITGDDTNDKRRTLSTSTGDGKSHNNLPPYKVVYYWRRTN